MSADMLLALLYVAIGLVHLFAALSRIAG